MPVNVPHAHIREGIPRGGNFRYVRIDLMIFAQNAAVPDNLGRDRRNHGF